LAAQLAAFSTILLRCDGRYLLLQRGKQKRFAPGRWTGIGGRVEPDEFDDLYESACREIFEETGIEHSAIRDFILRRALLQQRPDHPLTVLLYFTGDVDNASICETDEGTLQWLSESDIEAVDVIENTALVLPLLIRDMNSAGSEPALVQIGAASYAETGEITSLIWAK
jgi:8-oxo-dGTP diphosphatase